MQRLEQRAAALLGEHEEVKADCDLVDSVPGIGPLSAMSALAAIGPVARFTSASQVVAFVGVASAETSSGTSVRGSGAISKSGSPRFRKMLYMCAMSAMRWNPDFRQWASELKARGKAGRVVVVAVMRKLLHLIYGVLRSKTPYDARKAFPSHYASEPSQPVRETAVSRSWLARFA